MNKKVIQMVRYLQRDGAWVRGERLSAQFGVSTRQIRNYVSAANASGCLISSSEKGYRLLDMNPSFRMLLDAEDNPESRLKRLLLVLLFSSEPEDIFTFSEQFYVSVPTMEADLQKLRRVLREYALEIVRERDLVWISGAEKNKRRLLCNYCYAEQRNEYLANRTSFFPQDAAKEISLRQAVREKLLEQGIFANDYSLGNIALYLAVSAERICAGFQVEASGQLMPDAFNRIDLAVTALAAYMSLHFSLSLSEAETQALREVLIQQVSLLDYTKISPDNLNEFVEEKYCAITREIMDQVKQFYHIECFDGDFYVRFTLHIRNIFTRQQGGFFTRRVLDDSLKVAYPIAHDISVFIAQILSKNYGAKISDDEVTCIAFHICSCVYDYSKNRISAVFIYESYYDFFRKTAEVVAQRFSEDLFIKHTVSISDYLPSVYHADLLISTVDAPLPEPCVLIHPFPQKQDFAAIQTQIKKIRQKKERDLVSKTFLSYFNRDFFLRSTQSDSHALIRQMCAQVIDQQYATEDFTQRVLLRETMADTAFGAVAMPHALSFSTLKSFLSVAICDPPILWGHSAKKVQLVILIGTNSKERRTFSRIMDLLIEVVSDAANVAELERCENYDAFIDRFFSMLLED